MTPRDCPSSEEIAAADVDECQAASESLSSSEDAPIDRSRSPLPDDPSSRDASSAPTFRSAPGEHPPRSDVEARSQSGSTSSSLLARVRQRDPLAWKRFADLYTPLIYGWARRGGLRDSDAADVVQEVFRAVADKVDDFGVGREDPSFRGWLAAITRNQVRLYYRRLNSRPEAAGGTDAAARMENVPNWDDQHTDLTAADDRRYLLHRALRLIRGDFEESTWHAFWRTVVDGDSAPEVARALSMTPGAVRQAKFRVLRRLREEME